MAFCDGVEDDPAGPTAALSLQRCIDATPDGGAAEIAPLVYLLAQQLIIARPVLLRTAALADDPRTCLTAGIVCAQLTAAADLDADGGLVVLTDTDHAGLDHLVLDGNRGARLGSPAAQACLAGDSRRGQNAAVDGCTDCSFTWSTSLNALCGSGLTWLGDAAQISNGLFEDNGDNDAGFSADGLTVLRSDGASIIDNIFVDNSGVSLSVGGARFGSISDNQLRQVELAVSAALWLRGAGGASTGDFTGAQILSNSIDCGAQLCDFGIAVGSHAWDATVANTEGGLVSASSVVGAKLGILAEGAGTSAAPLAIYFNTETRSAASAQFACGARTSYAIDLSPDSVIDAGSDTAPYSSVTWHDCP